MDRRELLKAGLALSAFGLSPALIRAAAATASNDPGQPFDFAWLKGQARELAAKPYVDDHTPLPAPIAHLNYDQYQSIQYRADHSLWREDKLGIELRFFHMGLFFNKSVTLYEVVDGRAREILYDPQRFDLGKSGVDGKLLPKTLGYAGFRVNHHINPDIDLAAFLGASYFRAVGVDKQYGMSARGLAVDTGMPRPEEFPMFTHFWFEKPGKHAGNLVVYALLDSPSIAGAYRFNLKPGRSFVMDVDTALYPRQDIERLGIAPLTSMFKNSENDRRLDDDFRPEIHDSDGLAMWTGAGEWIWRPLVNPVGLRFNMYSDENPRGFGLLQRDRDFDHYQDDAVFYDKRPGVWIETVGSWGPGAVTLVEIPTKDETFDNIVAFWNPKQAPKPGSETLLSYRLHWGRTPPVAPERATVVATRTGLGGVVGQPRERFSWRFGVDFTGGVLPLLARKAKVEPVIWVSRGTTEITSARPLDSINGYRALFDLVPDDSPEPINIRLFLALDGEPLTETWLYQYNPPPVDQRKY
ncbi:MAG: glucan biosynthesis protein D [Gammaproteobacteria bacterium]|nr:glucan biosynthesis protein D [Gammaproteobacteria bacterium]